MKTEISQESKSNARHWCSSYLFNKKSPKNPNNKKEDAEAVRRRRAVEDSQARLYAKDEGMLEW